MQLAAYIREMGFGVGVLDCPTLRINNDEVYEIILKKDPAIIGFSTTTYSLSRATELAKKIRDKLPNKLTIIGGSHANVAGISTAEEYNEFDIVAYGFGGARYELTARLAVQDSPNSGGVVVSAIRFCKVAAEMGIVGYLRGPSAWTQKTPPLQLKTDEAKYECDMLANRQYTDITEEQRKENNPKASRLTYTYQAEETDYA